MQLLTSAAGRVFFASSPTHRLLPPTVYNTQVWQQHGEWITAHRPSFGPGVRERFEAAAAVTEQQFREAAAQRAAARQRLSELLGADSVLLLPTAPAPAPLRGTPADKLDTFRTSLMSLTCIAGLSGFPQVGHCCRVDGWVGSGWVGGWAQPWGRTGRLPRCQRTRHLAGDGEQGTAPYCVRFCLSHRAYPLLSTHRPCWIFSCRPAALQVNLPIAQVDGSPVGLGLLGPPGSDEDLLQLTEQLMTILRP